MGANSGDQTRCSDGNLQDVGFMAVKRGKTKRMRVGDGR